MTNNNHNITLRNEHIPAERPERDMLIYAMAELMRSRGVNLTFETRKRKRSIDLCIPMTQNELNLFLLNYQENIKSHE